MEKLFYPRHPELSEMFLTFLLPGHAAQVGKFYESWVLTNMNIFANKLSNYFSRQPAQVSFVYFINYFVKISTYFRYIFINSNKFKLYSFVKFIPV